MADCVKIRSAHKSFVGRAAAVRAVVPVPSTTVALDDAAEPVAGPSQGAWFVDGGVYDVVWSDQVERFAGLADNLR